MAIILVCEAVSTNLDIVAYNEFQPSFKSEIALKKVQTTPLPTLTHNEKKKLGIKCLYSFMISKFCFMQKFTNISVLWIDRGATAGYGKKIHE